MVKWWRERKIARTRQRKPRSDRERLSDGERKSEEKVGEDMKGTQDMKQTHKVTQTTPSWKGECRERTSLDLINW